MSKLEEFYYELQNVINKEISKDITIVMGDFNAKIGSDNTGYEEVMGKHGLGQMNENGEWFADLFALNQLVIGGSVFPHKDIHKATWVSLDHVTENQIDNFCISKKFRRSLQNVWVKRGADIASEHHLVLATLKMRLKHYATPAGSRMRYNVDLLRDASMMKQFWKNVSNRYQVLQDLYEDDGDMDMETEWSRAKKIWIDTCEETVGRKKLTHKDWMSLDTMENIEERKKYKAELNSS